MLEFIFAFILVIGVVIVLVLAQPKIKTIIWDELKQAFGIISPSSIVEKEIGKKKK